jgi:DNA-binding NtrC family response regulator
MKNMPMAEPIRILVVDDNEDLLATFTKILNRKGFYVETATNGSTAIDRYSKGDFDVTSMDIIMPDLNGVEAFRLIREIDPQAVVILMTGYSDEDLIQLAMGEGAQSILYKPVHVDTMLETIREVLISSSFSNNESTITTGSI